MRSFQGARPLPASRWWVAGLGLLAASLIVAGIAALTDRVVAASPNALRNLRFGRPFDWVSQDQGALDPARYPVDERLLSPWEHPTSIDVLPLVADVSLICAVLVVLWLGAAAWVRRGAGFQESPGRRN